MSLFTVLCELPLVALVVIEDYVLTDSVFGYSAIHAISCCVSCQCAICTTSSGSVIWYCVMLAV